MLVYVKLGYEIRSTNVHEQMLEMWKKNFEVKTVSKSKVHSNLSMLELEFTLNWP